MLCYDNQQKSMRSSKQCWLLLAKSRVHPQATIHCIIGFVKWNEKEAKFNVSAKVRSKNKNT